MKPLCPFRVLGITHHTSEIADRFPVNSQIFCAWWLITRCPGWRCRVVSADLWNTAVRAAWPTADIRAPACSGDYGHGNPGILCHPQCSINVESTVIISFLTLRRVPKITPCIIKSISQKVNSAHHVLRKLCCKVWIWWAHWTHFILRVTLQLTFNSLYTLQERIPSLALIRIAPASTCAPALTTCQPRGGARVMTTPSSGQLRTFTEKRSNVGNNSHCSA